MLNNWLVVVRKTKNAKKGFANYYPLSFFLSRAIS